MSYNSNTIYTTSTYGISIGDIKSFFGSSRNDIGALITNVEINKWAKYKPVRSGKLGIMSVADRKDVQHGLTTTVFTATGEPTTSGSFFNRLLAGTLPWDYLRPRGRNGGGSGVHEWYRILDFDGYDKRATPPFEPYEFDTAMLDYENKLVLQWVDLYREDYELGVDDLQIDGIDLNNWYFGAFIYFQNNGLYTFAAGETIGNGGLSVTFEDMQNWAGRTVKMVPFLSTIRLRQDIAESDGKYVSLMGFEPINLQIIANSSGVYAYPEGMWNSTNTRIDYTVEIVNTVLAKSGLTIVIQLVEGNNPATGTVVTSRTISNYSIGADTTDTITGSFTGLTRGNNPYFITIASSGDNVIRFTYNQIEDYDSPIPTP